MNAVVNLVALEDQIDRMGQLKAMISDLQAEYDAIADQYRARGPGRYEGSMFSASVSDEALVQSFDADKAKAKLAELGVPAEWVKGCTKLSVRKATVKVAAR